jgi:integrase
MIQPNKDSKKSKKIKKVGRPRKPYRDSDGNYINGLRRRKDGRWVIVETQKTFTEPDERLAIMKFRQWEARQQQRRVRMDSMAHGAYHLLPLPNNKSKLVIEYLPTIAEVEEAEIWAWVREQLISRPEYAGEQTGIPELGRLSDLPPRQPSPTLKSLYKLYADKADVDYKQVRQCQLFWTAFTKWLAKHDVTTVKQITTPLVADYGDYEKKRARELRDKDLPGGSLKYLRHRFNWIRRVFNFALKRGIHPTDIRHALDCCAVLSVPKMKRFVDPHPIERDDFHKLLEHAPSPRMRAFLICMLNLCMYPKEVQSLNWGDIDFEKQTVITRRGKTSIIRAGILWDETVEALIALKPDRPVRRDEPIFLTREGTRWSTKTSNAQFRKLRTAAGVDDSVKCADFRDGAYTAAIQAGASLDETKLLAGHSIGIPDHYLARNPEMVRPAVNGIYQAYYG